MFSEPFVGLFACQQDYRKKKKVEGSSMSQSESQGRSIHYFSLLLTLRYGAFGLGGGLGSPSALLLKKCIWPEELCHTIHTLA